MIIKTPTKKEVANNIIKDLHTLLTSYLLAKKYCTAKNILDFIVEIKLDSEDNSGINSDIIDNISVLQQCDLTDFYSYVKKFNVELLTY